MQKPNETFYSSESFGDVVGLGADGISMRDNRCCNARHKTPADALRSVAIGVMYIVCRACNVAVHVHTRIY